MSIEAFVSSNAQIKIKLIDPVRVNKSLHSPEINPQFQIQVRIEAYKGYGSAFINLGSIPDEAHASSSFAAPIVTTFITVAGK